MSSGSDSVDVGTVWGTFHSKRSQTPSSSPSFTTVASVLSLVLRYLTDYLSVNQGVSLVSSFPYLCFLSIVTTYI